MAGVCRRIQEGAEVNPCACPAGHQRKAVPLALWSPNYLGSRDARSAYTWSFNYAPRSDLHATAKGALRPQEPPDAVLNLTLSSSWAAFKRQSLAFWALNFYLFIEYVRPQSVWTALDVLPWGQLALGLTAAAVLTEPAIRRPFRLLDGLLALFSFIVLASLLTAYSPSYGFGLVKTFVVWVVLYYLVTRIVTTETRLFLFIAAFFLWSFKMSQFGARDFVLTGFQFRAWGVGGGPAWFQNSGEFAIQMVVFLAMVTPLLLLLRRRLPKWKTAVLLGLLPGTALASVVMSSSRGGQLAAAAVLCCFVAQSRYRVRGLAWAAVLLPALWFITPAEQKTRFSEMGEDNTSVTRFTYWRHGLEIMEDNPILGIGYGNWVPYYRTYYNPRGQLPHNIFIEAGSETGYLGLAAFVALIIGTFVVNARTRRMARALPVWGPFHRSLALGLDAALLGYLVAGFFVTVLYYPFFWVNLSFTSALYLLVERRYAALAHQPASLSKNRRQPLRDGPPDLLAAHSGVWPMSSTQTGPL